MATDWDIRPRADACCGCETPFQDQQPYHSCLTSFSEGHQRLDYCGTCWETTDKPTGTHSTWQGTYKAPPPKPEEPLKKETAESLLRKLAAKEDEANRNIIFILAVMLERKRILVERDVTTRSDGTLVRVYEHRETGDSFLVADPRLQLDRLEQVQQEVLALLGHKTADSPQEAAEEAPAPSVPGEVGEPPPGP